MAVVLLLASLPVTPVWAQCPTVCGDVNGSGSVEFGLDLAPLRSYLFASHTLDNLDCAEVDGHSLVTFGDFIWLAFSTAPDRPVPICPASQPALLPVASADFSLQHTEVFPGGSSTVLLDIELTTQDSVFGLLVPVAIRVNGEVPSMGPVSVPGLGFANLWTAEHPGAPPGSVVFHPFAQVGAGTHIVGRVELSMAATSGDRPISLEYLTLGPIQDSQQVNQLMVLASPYLTAYMPDVHDCTGFMAGDLDLSGGPSVQDLSMLTALLCSTHMLPTAEALRNADFTGDCVVDERDVDDLASFLSQGKPLPAPCACAYPRVGNCGDINADCNVTSADIIMLVNYVFKGGPPPVFGEWVARVTGAPNVTSASIIGLVNYIFKGGASPTCP